MIPTGQFGWAKMRGPDSTIRGISSNTVTGVHR